MIDKAMRSLEAAQLLQDAGSHDFAASRAYYAAFYAIQAALESKEPLRVSTHSAAISQFNHVFVKEAIFPQDFGQRINRLYRRRQTGDYSFSQAISASEAQSAIATARNVLDAIASYLVTHGFLPKQSSGS